MFRAGAPGPYDEVVAKATNETQTSENWGVLIEVCDQVVADKTATGARDCVAAVLRRLQHRSANVQLYCMTLSESLVKNCGEKLQREVASRTFLKGLMTIVQDRNTHPSVRNRVLQCLHSWEEDFKGNTNLGLVEETLHELSNLGFRHEEEPEVRTHPSDDVLKREEEELQRAIAESEREAEWMGMAGVGTFPSGPSTTHPNIGPGGYAPSSGGRAGSAYGAAANTNLNHSQPTSPSYQAPTSAMAAVSLRDNPVPPAAANQGDDVSLHPPGGATLYPMRTMSRPAPMRVRALYEFEATEEGELGLKEGDVIKVVDSAYKDWWRGELRGMTGIFPVNYVEPIPDPTPESLAKDTEIEATVFGQAGEIDRLLTMMRTLNAQHDNLADNDELSEVYQRTLMLRPKIVKLIEKYTEKKAELLQMNEKFMRAKKQYDNMMEESLAKYHPGVATELYTQPNLQYQQQYQQGQQQQLQANYYQQAPPQSQYAYDQPSYGHAPPPVNYGPPNAPGLPGSYPPQAPTPHSQPDHPQRPQSTLTPEIDTNRYYLASDGNWYAYAPETHPPIPAGVAPPSITTSSQQQQQQQPSLPTQQTSLPNNNTTSSSLSLSSLTVAAPSMQIQPPSPSTDRNPNVPQPPQHQLQHQQSLTPVPYQSTVGYGSSPYPPNDGQPNQWSNQQQPQPPQQQPQQPQPQQQQQYGPPHGQYAGQ